MPVYQWRKGESEPVRLGFGEREECLVCDQRVKWGAEPDPCLGTLAGIANACCGHGVEDPYVQLESPSGRARDRVVLTGEAARAFVRVAGRI